MTLKEHVYSILIVSASDKFTSAFVALLPKARYNPVCTATNVNSAKRTLSQKSFDFIIINAPLPDDSAELFAINASTPLQSAVLLLIDNDIHATIHDKVSEYGVFTLPKPISKLTLIYALSWLESARERLRQFEKKSISIEDKMAEIRLVNKAKWILISKLQMSESDAHRYLEKQAMDRCISRKTVAEEIIKAYS